MFVLKYKVDSKEYERNPLIRTKRLNTEKQETPNWIKTQNTENQNSTEPRHHKTHVITQWYNPAQL